MRCVCLVVQLELPNYLVSKLLYNSLPWSCNDCVNKGLAINRNTLNCCAITAVTSIYILAMLTSQNMNKAKRMKGLHSLFCTCRY